MTIALAPLTVTAGGVFPYSLGSAGTAGAVVVLNESPYGLNVSTGSSSQWIAAQTADLVPCDTMGFNGNLTITTDSYLDNASSAPSFLVYFTVFAPGEPIRGTYPTALTRLTSGNLTVGNNAAVTLEQDFATPFVLAGIAPSFTAPNLYNTTAGIAYPRQSDGSLLRTAVALYATTTSTPNATLFHDLNPDGTFSFATTHSSQPNYLTIATITTNASGNILTVTDTRVMSTILFSGMSQNPGGPGLVAYNLHINKTIQCDDEIRVQGDYKVTSGSTGNGYIVSIGSNDALYFMPSGSTQNQGAVFYYWVPGPNVALPLFSIAEPVGLVSIDTNGVLNARAPVTLAAGTQETGMCGVQFVATAAAQTFGVAVNFKTNMTNVPTSINLTPLASSNEASVVTSHITQYGFFLGVTCIAAGAGFYVATYSTVGN